MRMRVTGVMLGLSALTALPGQAQNAPLQQPFVVGETLVYHARMGPLASGTGEMRVEGPEAVRGRDTYRLSFNLRGGAGPVRMEGRTLSWLDPEIMAAMRFHKFERSPLGSSDEKVEIFPAEGTWRGSNGNAGRMPSRLPLDELSFLYYVRTLPLQPGARYSVDRHFDRSRNPVLIRVVGREQIRVPAGTFNTIVVEMTVPDDTHVSEGGVIRLNLTDDAWRVPVRIESSVRLVGKVVLTLQASNRHSSVALAPPKM